MPGFPSVYREQRRPGIPLRQGRRSDPDGKVAAAVDWDRGIHLWDVGTAKELALLRDRLRPVPAGDPEVIRPLLHDLESDRFAVRERAVRELERRGESAIPLLRKTLAAQPAPETRRQVEQLLQKVKGGFARTLRALEALEHIGTPQALALLQRLAKGIPEAPLTQEAKASPDRLSEPLRGFR